MKAGNLIPGPCQLKIVDGPFARLRPHNPASRLIWFTALSFRHLFLVVPVVGVALEGVDVQVLVIVLFLLGFRLRLGGAAEQLESLKRNDAEQ